MNINFANYIIELNHCRRDKLAITDGVQSLTYGQLSHKIKQVACGLVSMGITPGQTIAICMDDCVDWPVAFLGSIYAGAVPVPVANNNPQELFKEIINFVDCCALFVSDSIIERINSFQVPIISKQQMNHWYNSLTTDTLPHLSHPDAPGYMGLSSGSTGHPKVAVFRHQTLFDIAKTFPEALYGMDSSSIMLSLAKMSWGYGLHNTITYTLSTGATAIVIPDLPSPTVVFQTINKYNPTIVAASPGVIKKLLGPASKKHTLPKSVKRVHSSGEVLPDLLYNDFYKKFGIGICSGIGQLEVANSHYATTNGDVGQQGTVGQLLPGIKIKIIDNNDQVCSEGNIGEIYIHCKTIATYYLKDYNSTKNTFVGQWVKTGDSGFIDSHNNLVVVGRVDDLFKVNNLIVSPANVENEILKYADIEHVAVVGVKNSKNVIETHAFIVTKNQFDMDKFKQFLHDRLPSHQVPKQLHVLSQLPETVTGKKNRKEMSLIADVA
jgi:benzoate-CoA ligase